MYKLKEFETREEMYQYFPKGLVGAEIGVQLGRNAANLYLTAKPRQMYLVDVWENDGLNHHRNTDMYYKDHQAHVADKFAGLPVKLIKDKSLNWLNSLEDHFLDWIYIDGCHHYEIVSQEIEVCKMKVKKGGIIAGHDFANFPKSFGISVLRAVIESGLRIEAITKDTCPSYILSNVW